MALEGNKAGDSSKVIKVVAAEVDGEEGEGAGSAFPHLFRLVKLGGTRTQCSALRRFCVYYYDTMGGHSLLAQSNLFQYMQINLLPIHPSMTCGY